MIISKTPYRAYNVSIYAGYDRIKRRSKQALLGSIKIDRSTGRYKPSDKLVQLANHEQMLEVNVFIERLNARIDCVSKEVTQ